MRWSKGITAGTVFLPLHTLHDYDGNSCGVGPDWEVAVNRLDAMRNG